MASRASKQKDNTINIHSYPVQMHVGSQKFVNDDWGTMAYIIDRREIQNKFADPELRYNSIYFLFGYENNLEMCYVGQAKIRNNGESVLARLREHDDSTTEKYRDIWDWAVVVTNKNGAWTLDDLNALEHAFYAEIPVEQNLNGNNPNAGGADFDSYIDKIEQIKALVTTIGFSIFAKKIQTENIQVISETNEFSIVEDLQNGMARIPEIVTPHKVVKAMVDMLPADVWNDKTVFLDPACKGGEFLREIYDRLMDNEVMQSKYDNPIERSNHILKNQIYGIALSQVSLERTAKKLMGEDRNIRVIPNYIEILKTKFVGEVSETDKREYIMNILNKEFGKTMNIDVVIGNPPYQEITGGTGSERIAQGRTIYDRFIDLGIRINTEYMLMIVKNNWMSSNTLKEIREKIIKFGIYRIINYPVIGEVFNVSVTPCIIACKNDYKGELHYTEISNKSISSEYKADIHNVGSIIIPTSREVFEIIDKIGQISKQNISSMVHTKMTFGIATNGRLGATSTADFLDDSVIQTDEYNIKVYGHSDVTYTNIESFFKGKEYLNMYKVVCGEKINKTPATITSIGIVEAGAICNQARHVLGAFVTMNEAINYMKYIKTKLLRLLVWCNCEMLSSVSPDRFQLVPLQDFTSNSDIDWSQSIADIDKQLYKKYNLSEEEIAYIEKTIKPME